MLECMCHDMAENGTVHAAQSHRKQHATFEAVRSTCQKMDGDFVIIIPPFAREARIR